MFGRVPAGFALTIKRVTPPFAWSWTTAADILMVSLLAYGLLRVLRGTRAWQMLIGAVSLVLLLVAGRRLRMPILTAIGNQLFPIAILVLVVIFRTEIRWALERLGRAIMFRGRQSESGAYDDLVLAVSFFAQQQIGALIAIERETGLRTYIESGVPLDARISYDLLATIFRPAAPLHDGAVILQGDRIAAAACFLPLSMNPVLSNQLGTRHRAAIGITEETDAVAIIVSEENGQIAMAQAGKIERNLTVEQLRDRLSTLLKRYVPPTTLPTPLTGTQDARAALDRKPE
ncbi:MAG: TIGR00159 family protein [Acidobacteriales bacterium]|nr:TIGR00159 family protein [Terriglobales bacterium]